MTNAQKAIEFLAAGPKKAKEIASHLNIGTWQVANVLQRARDRGTVIAEQDPKARAKQFVYRLATPTERKPSAMPTFADFRALAFGPNPDVVALALAQDAWDAALVAVTDLLEDRAREVVGMSWPHPEHMLRALVAEIREAQ